MKRLVAVCFALGLATTASLALADVPNPTSSTSASTGSTSSSATGSGGGDSSGDDGGGCAASPGAARGSAALLLGLGMLFAIPLARRRNGAKK